MSADRGAISALPVRAGRDRTDTFLFRRLWMESSHLSALQTKHAGLERRIAEERARPSPNDVLLKELKRRKLKIKEELSQPH